MFLQNIAQSASLTSTCWTIQVNEYCRCTITFEFSYNHHGSVFRACVPFPFPIPSRCTTTFLIRGLFFTRTWCVTTTDMHVHWEKLEIGIEASPSSGGCGTAHIGKDWRGSSLLVITLWIYPLIQFTWCNKMLVNIDNAQNLTSRSEVLQVMAAKLKISCIAEFTNRREEFSIRQRMMDGVVSRSWWASRKNEMLSRVNLWIVSVRIHY